MAPLRIAGSTRSQSQDAGSPRDPTAHQRRGVGPLRYDSLEPGAATFRDAGGASGANGASGSHAEKRLHQRAGRRVPEEADRIRRADSQIYAETSRNTGGKGGTRPAAGEDSARKS